LCQTSIRIARGADDGLVLQQVAGVLDAGDLLEGLRGALA
jgi:hypothetical protein